MNPNLEKLHPYPFQKLRELLAGITPAAGLTPINLSIGEPGHDTPELVKTALTHALPGLSHYPTTLGSDALREAIAQWLARRYDIPTPDPAREVIPVNGSREALFSFAQAVVDASRGTPVVVCPNPFYQIYEGAALLAQAEPYYVNTLPKNNYRMALNEVPEAIWRRTQLLYLCSPGNPTGKVMDLDDWREAFALADRYGFTIASDECYSEIYFNEDHKPLGALQAARLLGRDYQRLVVFSSLSKRSNVPGMRSGFVAGDANILARYLLYRTYHGCAMNPAVQVASIAAWQDETHVVQNRKHYAEKFKAVLPLLDGKFKITLPDAAFYLWVPVKGSDTDYAQRLYREAHVTVLPGSFLAREAHGINPGAGFVRIALVAPLEVCTEAARRIVAME